MKVLLGSKNPSKKNALEIALKTLGFDEYEIISYNAPLMPHLIRIVNLLVMK